MFCHQVYAQNSKEGAFPWENYKVPNPKLVYIQVQALLRKSSSELDERSEKSATDKQSQIATSLTDAAIKELQRRPDVAFDEDGANIFATWMQFGAQKLVEKEDTSSERIKAAKIDVLGLIDWMITDANLNPLPAVKITADLLKKVHAIFCPLYPFC